MWRGVYASRRLPYGSRGGLRDGIAVKLAGGAYRMGRALIVREMLLEQWEDFSLGVVKRSVRHRRFALRFDEPHQSDGGRRVHISEGLAR
jgi:hypothetical protein